MRSAPTVQPPFWSAQSIKHVGSKDPFVCISHPARNLIVTSSVYFRNVEQTFGARAFVSVILLTLLVGNRALAQDASQLFHKMQEALGGADNIAAIHDFEEIVRADAWHDDGRPMGVVRKRVRFIRPSYVRIDQVGREDTYLLYFDGTSGWEILPNRTIADLVGDELKFAKHYLWGLNLNVWLADRNQQSRITSPAPNVLVVTDKNDPSLKEELALDTKTFLPTKSGSLSHWQAFAGVKFPQRISNFHNGKRVAVITVERTKINQGLKPADLAVRPPDLKPVMPEP